MHGIGTDAVGIVLVEDHTVVRQGLRAVLDREPDLRVVGEAADRAGALEVVAAVRPAVVVLDLRLGAGGHHRRSGRVSRPGRGPPRGSRPWS